MISLINPDPSSRDDAVYYTASGSRRVPLNSTWHVTAYMVDDDGTTTMVTSNKVVVTEDTELVLDGRLARPLDITVPDRQAAPYSAAAVVNRTADGLYTHSGVSGDPRTIRTADVGPKGLPGVITQVHAVFQGKAQKGRAPTVYQVGWRTEGSFITGLVKHVKRSELATVDVGYAQNATGVQAWRTNTVNEPSLGGSYPLSSELPPVVAPTRRTEYYTGDLPWRSTLRKAATADEVPVLELARNRDLDYRPGRRYDERWDGAVLNTTLTPVYEGSYAVVRQGDTLWASFSAWADGEGHVGSVYPVTNSHLSLHRGDTLLGEFTGPFGHFGNWELTAELATYRLAYAVDLPAPFQLSQHMESVWTFTSSAAQQNEQPLTSIGFRPDLGLDNSARAGSVVAVPLTFAQQPAAAGVKSASVSVSFDEGATWRPVPTANLAGTYTAAVWHPRDTSGFVSLRATAVDAKGNTVTTTVLRAYRVK
jgi:hypothetical protein